MQGPQLADRSGLLFLILGNIGVRLFSYFFHAMNKDTDADDNEAACLKLSPRIRLGVKDK